MAKVVQDEAQVKRAEATQRQTELDVARYTPLAQRGSVSQQELDNAVQSNLANLATVAASRAAVQNSQASVSQARAALEKSHADVKTQEATIAARPRRAGRGAGSTSATRGCCRRSAGVAGFRGANIGDLVGPSDPTPLTTVSQADPIYAEFPISEQRALAVFRRWDADPSAPRSIELELILADGGAYPVKGRGRRARPAGRRDHRHRARARRVPEPRQRAAARPVREGARGEHSEGRAAGPPARRQRRAGRSPGRGGPARRDGRSAHGEDRRAHRLRCGSSPRD